MFWSLSLKCSEPNLNRTIFCETKAITIVDDKQVKEILEREGYRMNKDELELVNTFPSPMDSFQYALYSFGQEDFYIVLMINIKHKSIYGYHILDLTEKNSLADDLINRLKNKNFVI
jgi:hypothetical protein